MSTLTVDVPAALAPLLEPARYKAAYGGRGGAKSHFFAEQMVLRCYRSRTRAACIREVQSTIKDSVRQLLIDKIQKLGLGGYFEVLETEIRAPNGSLIVFKGMQSYNAENIKSLEDFDIAWVEEAQSLSEKSLRLLRPTIRADNSEIWFSWNPRYETDPVDAFFRGKSPPSNAAICPVGWEDNPWFPGVLVQEKTDDYEVDEETAEHVWGGAYETVSEAAYYSRHILAAEREGRIGYFPHDPKRPVFTAWDIGVDDYTAIWFFQHDGTTVTVIDYYEASGFGADEVVAEAMPEFTQDLQDRIQAMLSADRDKPFEYEKHYLPHDVGNREWGAGARTRVQTLMGLGLKMSTINRGARLGPEERINATRKLLPSVRFHRSTRVMLGVRRLRRYSRKRNDQLGTYTTPLHDDNSHGADAFGEFALNCGIRPEKTPPAKPPPAPGSVYLPGAPQPKVGTRITL